ncbi:hypothetical protein [Rubrivirga sp.]|uniref:hypothetical protein n=1 Tax=Rubrivirga sp. TaxID=1885344 RepID=UPI003C78CA81
MIEVARQRLALPAEEGLRLRVLRQPNCDGDPDAFPAVPLAGAAVEYRTWAATGGGIRDSTIRGRTDESGSFYARVEPLDGAAVLPVTVRVVDGLDSLSIEPARAVGEVLVLWYEPATDCTVI